MNLDEKKEFVFYYIRIIEEFLNGHFETMEMFLELDAFTVLENFLYDSYLNDSIMSVVFLSSALEKLQEDN